MKRNYSMMLRQLQMGYMPITMKDVKEEEQCLNCWKNDCGCSQKHTIKDDPFINFTGEELNYA